MQNGQHTTNRTSQATYTNTATGETYTLVGVKSLASAWNLAAFVCSRNNWNLEMFSYDVKVRFTK